MRIALALFLSLVVVNATAQNLVPNPSFEEYLECPYSTAEFQTQVVDWYSFGVTPDYFHVCSNNLEGYAGVPENSWGYQQPVSGNAYAAAITYTHSTSNEREYPACPLTSPLEVGQEYYIMFYISMIDGMDPNYAGCATNRFGAKFFLDPAYGPEENERYYPQNTSDIQFNEMLIDSTSWILVEGTFVADSAYNWLALGNFYDDNNTDTLELGWPDYCIGLYYIDNVCVSQDPSDCDYLLSNSDSFNDRKQKLNIYPNPATSHITIETENRTNSIVIKNLLGQIFYRRSSDRLSTTINIEKWERGIYVVLTEFDDGTITSTRLLKQ